MEAVEGAGTNWSGEEVMCKLATLFERESLEQLARDSRFIERSSSRLSAWMFLELHLLMESAGSEFSLT